MESGKQSYHDELPISYDAGSVTGLRSLKGKVFPLQAITPDQRKKNDSRD